eukprot:10435197-Alexandrium_andersonii.AAC.1
MSKLVATTGISAPVDLEITFPDNWGAARGLHQFRKVVGKLQWLAHVMPDIAVAVKILSRVTSNLAADSGRE